MGALGTQVTAACLSLALLGACRRTAPNAHHDAATHAVSTASFDAAPPDSASRETKHPDPCPAASAGVAPAVVVEFALDRLGFEGFDGKRLPGVNANVTIAPMGAKVRVFSDSIPGCFSCRAHSTETTLFFDCRGDESHRDGTVTFNGREIVTEWVEKIVASRERFVRREALPIPCGSKVVFRSRVKDGRRFEHGCGTPSEAD